MVGTDLAISEGRRQKAENSPLSRIPSAFSLVSEVCMNRSHAEDLELAGRCASGDPEAWDRFVLEFRPVLYRAADALDRHGGAREVADALYAELYGVRNAHGQRQSLFRYFQGRSSLATWLRAVLAQRYVDRQRAQRRLAPLADADAGTVRASAAGGAPGSPEPDPSRARYVALLRRALGGGAGRPAGTGAPAARVLLRPGTDPRRNRPRDRRSTRPRCRASWRARAGPFVTTSNAGSRPRD